MNRTIKKLRKDIDNIKKNYDAYCSKIFKMSESELRNEFDKVSKHRG